MRQASQGLAARRGLLKEEKDKDYRFETDEGSASLADLFRGRSQLLVYHFMFGPDVGVATLLLPTRLYRLAVRGRRLT